MNLSLHLNTSSLTKKNRISVLENHSTEMEPEFVPKKDDLSR